MRLLLVSTYELGRQPVHVASPAGSLRRAGVDIRALDLSVDRWDPAMLDGVDAVAFSVPMHTAMRLAVPMARQIRRIRPTLPIAFYGLYAGAAADLEPPVADALFAGEYEPALLAWATEEGGIGPSGTLTHLGPSDFTMPDRSPLPSHGRYARLEWGGEARLAAAVEASHGCRHRCRHCPIPAVYDGRMRVVGADQVLADIDQLAGAGVEHVTFGDPDFLNAPRYSMDLLRMAHRAHPDLTFDVTVKVEHILEHRSFWPEMAGLGVLFVVSAFETTDDATLRILDKGHSAADMSAAVEVLRAAGIHVRPTWLPFFPWTWPRDLVDIARFLDDHDLWPATDPVQLAIRLLIPKGSLLEGHPDVLPHLAGYDHESLTWSWEFEHPDTARLHADLEEIASQASDCGEETAETLGRMRSRIGMPPRPVPVAWEQVPRLTESWFCCSEPTPAQAEVVGLSIAKVPLARR